MQLKSFMEQHGTTCQVFTPGVYAALKPSTVLSQAVITAGAIISVGLKLPNRHPIFPKASLIDFDIVLALTPVLLVGVSAGQCAGTWMSVHFFAIRSISTFCTLSAVGHWTYERFSWSAMRLRKP